MKPQVLLLGHTGFIGSHIFQVLQNKNIPTQGIATKDVNLLNPKSINYLSKKLTKNTIIIITAAINRELGDNLKTFQDNIKMITHVSLALESINIKRCIYLSTADVYGIAPKLPITEETPVAPQTYYATAKYTCEQVLQITCKKNNIPLLVLRYNGIFGPGQKNIGYGPNYFIKSIAGSGVVRIWGNGKELRDTLYVKDLAKIICALSLGNAKGIYNIAAGKSQRFIDMLTQLKKISRKKFKIEKRKRTSQAFDQVFEISKLKKKLPLFKFTPIKVALEETWRAI